MRTSEWVCKSRAELAGTHRSLLGPGQDSSRYSITAPCGR